MCVNARNAETKGDAKRFESPPPTPPAPPTPGGGAATAITCVQDECAMPRMRGGECRPPPGCRDTPRRQRQKHKKMARWKTVRGSLSGCILCTGCLERKSWLGIPVALRLRARREVPADSYALPKTTPPVGGVDGVPRGARRRACGASDVRLTQLRLTPPSTCSTNMLCSSGCVGVQRCR